jgi:transcriptional antiterminator NusG
MAKPSPRKINAANMKNKKDWYAVYTRPRWEKKVSSALTKKHIENYCPLNKEIHQWADRKKVVYEPLFNNYVFVYANKSQYQPIRQTEGILNFVYWLGTPARISEGEIESIRHFLQEHEHVDIDKIEVNVNDTVRIITGPLIHYNGSVEEVRRNTVKLLLPSLGYMLVAEVAKKSIEIIEPSEKAFNNKPVPHETFG